MIAATAAEVSLLALPLQPAALQIRNPLRVRAERRHVAAARASASPAPAGTAPWLSQARQALRAAATTKPSRGSAAAPESTPSRCVEGLEFRLAEFGGRRPS